MSVQAQFARIDREGGRAALVTALKGEHAGQRMLVHLDGQTAKIKANTREKGGQSNAMGDVTISVSGNNVNISANAQVSGKAASMGEGTVVAVLTQLVKSFAGNLAKA